MSDLNVTVVVPCHRLAGRIGLLLEEAPSTLDSLPTLSTALRHSHTVVRFGDIAVRAVT